MQESVQEIHRDFQTRHITVFCGGNAVSAALDKLGEVSDVVEDRRINELFLYRVIKYGGITANPLSS